MPPKPEYWKLNDQQFKQIKLQLEDLANDAFDYLKQFGLKKIKTSRDWLGFTIEKNEGEYLTFVTVLLIREKPMMFKLIARQWNTSHPSKTCKELYQQSFSSIHDLIQNEDWRLELSRILAKE